MLLTHVVQDKEDVIGIGRSLGLLIRSNAGEVGIAFGIEEVEYTRYAYAAVTNAMRVLGGAKYLAYVPVGGDVKAIASAVRSRVPVEWSQYM